jgi:hypothetical protein
MRFTRPFLVLSVVVLSLVPQMAGAHHVSETDLLRVFHAGADSEPLEPHGRILPWANQLTDGGDPNLRCVGDAVGSWAGSLVTYGDGLDFADRSGAIRYLNSIEQTYALDVYSDGDPVELKTKRSGVTWGESLSGDPAVWYRQGIPVFDGNLLPEGFHTLHWQANDDDGILFDNEAPIWMADCERESNLVANADVIEVEISTIDVSGYYNLIYLGAPGDDEFIGVDGSGDSKAIAVGTGTELIFRIDVWACNEGEDWGHSSCGFTGDSYYSGPASNNADGQKYSLHIADGSRTWVFFNDNPIDPNGADEPWEPNYIDAIFTVNPASP